jgi:hypothetical protein
MSTGPERSRQAGAFSSNGLTAFQDELRKIGSMLGAKLPKPKLPKSSVPTPKVPTARGPKAEYITGASEISAPPQVTGTNVPGRAIGAPSR